MLSSALIATHDGIVGYWDGTASRNPLPFGKGDADISYLSATVRGDLLDSILTPYFTVTGSDGTATMTADGHKLLTLNRPSRDVFRQQLAMVRAYSDLRDDRLPEILEQTEDLLSFFGAVGYLDTDRNGKSLELISAAIRLAVHVEMPFKHFCRSARPIDFAHQVQPMIQTPDHSSYPSGHATEVFTAATVMARLMTGLGPKAAMTGSSTLHDIAMMPFKVAHRVATNRSVAGVHFPIDSAAGAAIGCALGEAIYLLATNPNESEWPPEITVSFAEQADTDPPFDLTFDWLADTLADDVQGDTPHTDILGTYWSKAAAEWEELPL
ncbi:MAG: phosphatase PAP2 family protein [Boseongicola sp.]|nr:phosphatase PAP2 family protein [Boseongicola sp.]